MNWPTPGKLIIATPIVPTLANRANAIMQVHIHSNETFTMSERDGMLCYITNAPFKALFF